MTEAEWLAADEPLSMVTHLAERYDSRRPRLFTTACCRRVEHLLRGDVFWELLDASEAVADDAREVVRLHGCWDRAAVEYIALDSAGYYPRPSAAAAWCVLQLGGEFEVGLLLMAVGDVVVAEASEAYRRPEEVAQAALARCVFGNPFRPPAFDPTWRTEAVAGLARGIYDARAFDWLPVLADALEDAGCTDGDVLAHCRGDGPHARGCWVVDAVIGRG